MTDTNKRIRELLAERDLAQSRHDHDQVGLLESFIMDKLPALVDENDLLEQCVKDTCEDMECLPSCDSYAHDECCPVANPIHAWRQLKAEVERLAECEEVASRINADLRQELVRRQGLSNRLEEGIVIMTDKLNQSEQIVGQLREIMAQELGLVEPAPEGE